MSFYVRYNGDLQELGESTSFDGKERSYTAADRLEGLMSFTPGYSQGVLGGMPRGKSRPAPPATAAMRLQRCTLASGGGRKSLARTGVIRALSLHQ